MEIWRNGKHLPYGVKAFRLSDKNCYIDGILIRECKGKKWGNFLSFFHFRRVIYMMLR